MFLAFASNPDSTSHSPSALSPNTPFSFISVAFSSSPTMDFTGYRHTATNFPTADILHLHPVSIRSFDIAKPVEINANRNMQAW
jgi:hypothetical protein